MSIFNTYKTTIKIKFQERIIHSTLIPKSIEGKALWTVINNALEINNKDFRLNYGSKEIYPSQQLWNFKEGDVIQLKLRLLGGAQLFENYSTKWVRKDTKK